MRKDWQKHWNTPWNFVAGRLQDFERKNADCGMLGSF
jgi:hypothetical protein